MRLVGIGYRKELAPWIHSRPKQVGCLEITAEHFFDSDKRLLKDLRKTFPLMVHGLGLSLGTPGPIDRKTLKQFSDVVRAADPLWISEHVAFTRTDEVDLGHLNPIRPCMETLELMAEHALELSSFCKKPLLLENITSHLRLPGPMTETEFLNRLCDKADCGLLLDVTNLFINSRNHGFDPKAWLRELDPKRIVQLHVVGYSRQKARFEDFHAEAIQDDLFELIQETLSYGSVQAVILERDSNFPAFHELERELESLEDNLAPI